MTRPAAALAVMSIAMGASACLHIAFGDVPWANAPFLPALALASFILARG